MVKVAPNSGGETLDLDALRTFTTGIALGSFARAARRLGRSPSALSAQLRKLETQAGGALVRKAGRGLVPTERGEVLLAQARRLFDLHAEVVRAVRGADAAGRVRIGVQEDFGSSVLPETLERLARARPGVRIEARVARNRELRERVASNTLDLALIWQLGGSTAELRSGAIETVAEVPMIWIGPRSARKAPSAFEGAAVPLVAFDSPCLFATAAAIALEGAGIAWEPAFTSPSLEGLWAAASAGIGVTVRTPLGVPSGLRPMKKYGELRLPALSSVRLALLTVGKATAPAVSEARAILLDVLESRLAVRSRRLTAGRRSTRTASRDRATHR